MKSKGSMKSTCPICNKLSNILVKHSYVVCKKCFETYGTIDEDGESMTFLVEHGLLYSDVNGVITRHLECQILNITCHAILHNDQIYLIKTQKIPIKNTLRSNTNLCKIDEDYKY